MCSLHIYVIINVGQYYLSLKLRYKGGSFLLLIETIVVFTLLYVNSVLQNVVLIVFVIIVGAIIVKFFSGKFFCQILILTFGMCPMHSEIYNSIFSLI